MKHSLSFEKQVLEAYRGGITIKDILKKYSCSPSYVNKIANKYNIRRVNLDKDYIEKKYNCTKLKYLRDDGKKEIRYEVPCAKCETKKIVTSSQIQRKDMYICDKCSNYGDTKVIRSCKLKKRKSNTSGYIGVWVYNHQTTKEPEGYMCVIAYRKQTVLKNRYKDNTLHEKTLIQAAVDRDCFIIEHDLPHTRNLTDDELIANMQMLGMEELKTIEKGLKNERKSMYTIR